MLKYLVKFLNRQYLNYMLNDGLYMNPAYYYVFSNCETNQSDKYEGIASLPLRSNNLHKNLAKPIWCCVGIDEQDIIDNKFKIDRRLLEDFFKNDIANGVLVVIDYNKFINHIHQFPDEYEIRYSNVAYVDFGTTQFDVFISGKWYDSLFVKSEKYSYQKEFRLVIYRNCKPIYKDIVLQRIPTQILESYQPYEYRLPNLKSISSTVNAIDLLRENNNFYLDFSHIHID